MDEPVRSRMSASLLEWATSRRTPMRRPRAAATPNRHTPRTRGPSSRPFARRWRTILSITFGSWIGVVRRLPTASCSPASMRSWICSIVSFDQPAERDEGDEPNARPRGQSGQGLRRFELEEVDFSRTCVQVVHQPWLPDALDQQREHAGEAEAGQDVLADRRPRRACAGNPEGHRVGSEAYTKPPCFDRERPL